MIAIADAPQIAFPHIRSVVNFLSIFIYLHSRKTLVPRKSVDRRVTAINISGI